MQMQVIIQCAGSKTISPSDERGYFRTGSGKRVKFVGRPELAEPEQGVIFCRPDDPSDEPGMSWRHLLRRYVETGTNPFGLKRACELYANKIYINLVDHFGPDNVFILSAGWGLISANFPTPAYDITFSSPRKDKKTGKERREVRRSEEDEYQDFQDLPQDVSSPVMCFVTQTYMHQIERMGLRRDLRYPPGRAIRIGIIVPRKTSSKGSWRYERVVWLK